MQKIINKIIKLIIIVSIVFASELIFGINTYAEGSFKQTLHTGTGEFNISAENKDFKASQSISLNISKTYKSGIGGLFQRISSTVNRRNIETIKVEIIKNDKPISTQDKEISSTTNNINLDTKDLTPGSYTLKITDSDGNSIKQDFTWGVLAINTNKSIFSPQEDAKISMAVLNDSGKMVCDAKVKLEIRNPKSELVTLSTDNKTIKVNAECEIKDYTLTPDYESIYKTSEPGTYTMSLTATTSNGTRSITDSFEVRQNPEYDIERITATRLYPVNDYPVILNIKANQDFQGIVQEKVEQNFEVHYLSSEELNKKFGLTENLEKGLVSTLPGSHNENDNILKWQVNWKKGETYTVAYYYNPPDKSPDFFTIGPLELINNQGQTIFKELRVWQLANDDISTGIIVAWPSTVGTIPSGWQRVTALDSTYTREVPNASTDPGATGGSTTHTHTTLSHDHTISHTHVSATSGQAVGSITAGTASNLDLDPTTHTHTTGTISATTDNSGGATPSTSGTTSNDPAYLSVIWITPTTTDTGIPDGALAMFNTTTLPGSWAIYTNSQDRFLKGAVSSGDGGGTGGTATHNHTGEGSHTHTSNHTHPGGTTAISGNQGNSYAAGTVAAGDNHTHPYSVSSGSFGTSVAATLNSSTDNHEPTYQKVAVIENQTGSNSLPSGIIAIWRGAIADIPDNWYLCDGNNSTPNLLGDFSKGAVDTTELGNPGGGTSHTHTGVNHANTWSSYTHTHTVNLESPPSVIRGTSGATATWANPTHTHTATSGAAGTVTVGNAAPNLESATHTPPYEEVAYIQYNAPSGDTYSGNVYTDDGEGTGLGSVSVCLAVNGTHNAADCDTTDGTGYFSFTTAGDTAQNDQLTFFIDDASNHGNTVTVATGNAISTIKIYQNHVTVRHDQGSSITIAQMDAYDLDQNSADVFFDAEVSTTNTLTVEDGYEFYIPSTYTFAPGGNLNDGVGKGIDDIKIKGTYTAASSESILVSGSWDSSSATFTASTSTVTFDAPGATTETINSASSFNTIVFNDNSGGATFQLSAALDVNGSLTITGGTLDTGSNRQINVGGTFTNNDIFTQNSGAVVIDGTSGSIAGTTNTTFYDLTIDPTSAGTVTLSSSDPTVSHTLSVASGDILSLGSSRLMTLGSSSTLTLTGTISGSGTLIYQSSNTFPTTGNISSLLRFDAQNGNHSLPQRTNGYEGNTELYNNSATARTFAFGTAGGQTITFNGNLTLNGSSGTVEITALNNPTVNISGNLAGTSGGSVESITTGTGTWTVTGSVNLTNISSFTATGGTFQMNGVSTTLTSSGKSFNNFKASGGSIQTADTMTATGTFEVLGSAAFIHAVGNMTVTGTFTLTSGSFTHGAGADIDILVGGNFTLQSGTTWTENTTASSQLILTGDLYYDDNTAGQSVGNVQIGNSPGTTWLSGDMAANSLLVSSGDYYYTCGWEADIADGGITIDGTFDATRTAAGCTSDTDQTTINDGNLFNLSGTGTFVPDQSTIIFDDGSGTNNLTTAGSGSFYNMEVQGVSNNIVLQDALDIDNNLTLTAGTLDTGTNYQINVGGNWDNNGGTFTESLGKVVFDGLTSSNLDSGCADEATCTTQNFYDLEINKTDIDDADDNVTLSTTHLRLTNTLTITDGELVQGTLDIRAEGTSAVSVGANGKWTNISTGDLTLGGSFANSGTVTFQGNGTSCGDTNTDLVIASTTTSQRSWTSSGGTYNFNDVSVSWQGGTAAIADYNGFNGGNNDTNWSFGGCPVNITGYVYDFGTANALFECDGSAQTLELRVASTTQTTYCDNSSGAFTFNNVPGPSTGDSLVIWIDSTISGGTKGAMVIRYDGAGASDNNVFYDDAVTVTSDDTTAVDIDDFNFFDNANDGDIPYTANNATPDTLTVNSGFELYVLKKSTVAAGSTVFDPNGTVTTNAIGGDLHIGADSKAYLDNASSIGRDVEVDGGGTLDFNATTTIGGGDITTAGTSATVSATTGNPSVTISGTGNVGGGTNPSINLYDLQTSGSGTTSIVSTVTTATDVIVGAGTTLDVKADLNINGGDLTTTGSATVTTTSGTPTVNITGTGTLGGGSNTMTFYNLTEDGTSTTYPNSPITVNNTLTVGDGVNTATFQDNTADKAISTLDLEIKASGVYSASSDVLYPLTVSRNFTNNGTFTSNAGKIVFNTTNTSTLSYAATTTFGDFSVTTPGKHIKFDETNGRVTDIDGALTLTGNNCSSGRVFLEPDVAANFWDIAASGSTSISYIDVQYSIASPGLSADNSTADNGNNTGWTIIQGACGGALPANLYNNVRFFGGVRLK